MSFVAAISQARALLTGWRQLLVSALAATGGFLLGAVLLVPVLGIPQTCAAVALVGLAGLLALA